MQSIIQDANQTGADTVDTGTLSSRLRSAMFTALVRRRTRRVVQGLSEAQLKDSGIDRAAVLGGRPVNDVDVRLATYLASLR